jgi:hypothetical protein
MPFILAFISVVFKEKKRKFIVGWSIFFILLLTKKIAGFQISSVWGSGKKMTDIFFHGLA